MITLFRRIREKLIGEGNARRYLIYAVGEIALVMIGILLALQVNNWNEMQKARAEERILLQTLKTDYETRLDELVQFTAVRNEALESIKQLSFMIAFPDSMLPDDEMDELFVSLNNLIMFNDQFKVLDVLFNTGKIDQISNRELKTLILKWPQNVEEMMEEQRIRYDVFFTFLLPLQYEYLSLRNIFEKFNFRGYEFPEGLSVNKKADYQGILSDPLFENYLAQAEILYRINGFDYIVLIENAEQIIDLLDQELEY